MNPDVTLAIMAIMLPGALQAQSAAMGVTNLRPVVVTATRVDTSPFDTPASINVIGSDVIGDGRMQVNISESLGGVPGLVARDRQNYAQDVQISVRGFGARSTFGIRGVRLYVDGIPGTLPDGQGQISHVDLGSAERIEVLRGPFSALYGNSSGGVLQVFTEEGSGAPVATFSVASGSDGAQRVATKLSGAQGDLGFVVGLSHFATDGYRAHSAAQRSIDNVKLTLPSDSGKLTLVANRVDIPKAQDPLGLSRAQFDLDPRGVDPSATAFNTRKTVEQSQLGLLYEHKLHAASALRLLVYAGQRGTEQFQAIPTGPQNNPLHPGGMISLERDYTGADLRWTLKASSGDRPVTVVAGLAYDLLKEDRKGYQNFIGNSLGVQGGLRRDERNNVSNFDQYLQLSWQFEPNWKVDAGLRRSGVSFRSTDRYIVGPNGDDSGKKKFGATLPVLSLMYNVSDALHLYATAGRGFETPTLNELAYRPDGTPGLNFTLKAARSDNIEAGAKTRVSGMGELTVAVFQTRTRNEIVTQTNSGGRASFQNATGTRREGLEFGWSARLGENLRTQVAFTWLNARYQDGFASCAATPCAAPNQTIPAGNRIPGTARSSLYGSLAWAPASGWRAGLEIRAMGRIAVNDANSDAAAGYAVAGAHLGYALRHGPWEFQGFGRVDNAFARSFAGSVIVNDGNARFFEPASRRTWTAGLSAARAF